MAELPINQEKSPAAATASTHERPLLDTGDSKPTKAAQEAQSFLDIAAGTLRALDLEEPQARVPASSEQENTVDVTHYDFRDEEDNGSLNTVADTIDLEYHRAREYVLLKKGATAYSPTSTTITEPGNSLKDEVKGEFNAQQTTEEKEYRILGKKTVDGKEYYLLAANKYYNNLYIPVNDLPLSDIKKVDASYFSTERGYRDLADGFSEYSDIPDLQKIMKYIIKKALEERPPKTNKYIHDIAILIDDHEFVTNTVRGAAKRKDVGLAVLQSLIRVYPEFFDATCMQDPLLAKKLDETIDHFGSLDFISILQITPDNTYLTDRFLLLMITADVADWSFFMQDFEKVKVAFKTQNRMPELWQLVMKNIDAAMVAEPKEVVVKVLPFVKNTTERVRLFAQAVEKDPSVYSHISIMTPEEAKALQSSSAETYRSWLEKKEYRKALQYCIACKNAGVEKGAPDISQTDIEAVITGIIDSHDLFFFGQLLHFGAELTQQADLKKSIDAHHAEILQRVIDSYAHSKEESYSPASAEKSTYFTPEEMLRIYTAAVEKYPLQVFSYYEKYKDPVLFEKASTTYAHLNPIEYLSTILIDNSQLLNRKKLPPQPNAVNHAVTLLLMNESDFLKENRIALIAAGALPETLDQVAQVAVVKETLEKSLRSRSGYVEKKAGTEDSITDQSLTIAAAIHREWLPAGLSEREVGKFMTYISRQLYVKQTTVSKESVEAAYNKILLNREKFRNLPLFEGCHISLASNNETLGNMDKFGNLALQNAMTKQGGKVTPFEAKKNATNKEVDDVKKRVLEEVATAPEPYRFVGDGHGSSDGIYLNQGQMKNGKIVEGGVFIKPTELATAYKARTEKYGPEAVKTNIVMLTTCHNYNFMLNFYSELKKIGSAMPLGIANSEYGQFAYSNFSNKYQSDFFNKILGVNKEKSTFGQAWANDDALNDSNPSFFVPDDDGDIMQISQNELEAASAMG